MGKPTAAVRLRVTKTESSATHSYQRVNIQAATVLMFGIRNWLKMCAQLMNVTAQQGLYKHHQRVCTES